MYLDDEHLPHCHARHAGLEMLVDIGTLEILAGRLEPAAQRKALAWCRENQALLMARWEELHP